jgi:hypothetical protein
MDSAGSGEGPVEGLCKCGYELSGPGATDLVFPYFDTVGRASLLEMLQIFLCLPPVPHVEVAL